MVDGHALLGHVFANVSVAGVLDCYKACQPNCRCISFNFLTNVNQNNCQLNEENRHLKPGALKAVEGSQYYDLVINYNMKVNFEIIIGYIQNFLKQVSFKHRHLNVTDITAKLTNHIQRKKLNVHSNGQKIFT